MKLIYDQLVTGTYDLGNCIDDIGIHLNCLLDDAVKHTIEKAIAVSSLDECS